MNKLVHIERVGRTEVCNPTLCGLDEYSDTSITYRSSLNNYEFVKKPTCEACILIAWTNPEKVFKII